MYIPTFNEIRLRFDYTDCVTFGIVRLDPEFIVINAWHFQFSFSRDHLALLDNVLANHYKDHTILVLAPDGEDLITRGLTKFLNWACNTHDINPDCIIIYSHSPESIVDGYRNQTIPLDIFNMAGIYVDLTKIKSSKNQKFVGLLVGRFDQYRLQLAYDIDRCFPGDNFITFLADKNLVIQQLKNTSTATNEINWITNKVFDSNNIQPIYSIGSGAWKDSYQAFNEIAGSYCIEVIAETDPMINHWFTEKTARCLVAGMPFLLLSGHASLAKLRNMGFKTFNEVIDESYDLEISPSKKINKIIKSLEQLYNDTNRLEKIQRMIQIAQDNQKIYLDKYVTSTQKQTYVQSKI